MFEHIINSKYLKMLICLQGKELDMKELSRKSNINYYFLSGRIRAFVESGVLTKKQKKNTHIISLTEKGKQATQKLIEIKKIMEEK